MRIEDCVQYRSMLAFRKAMRTRRSLPDAIIVTSGGHSVLFICKVLRVCATPESDPGELECQVFIQVERDGAIKWLPQERQVCPYWYWPDRSLNALRAIVHDFFVKMWPESYPQEERGFNNHKPHFDK